MKKLLALFLLSGCAYIGAYDLNDDIGELPPGYIDYASTFISYHEESNRKELTDLLGIDPVETEWCAAFVNSMLQYNNIPGTDSLVARSFLKWGKSVTEPKLGDIVIFSRGNEGWQGHVAFFIDYIEIDGRQYIAVLGGNQNNQVSIKEYPTSRLLDIRRYVPKPDPLD